MERDRCVLLCLDVQRAERLRTARLSPSGAQEIAARFKAFADPTRLTIAAALLEGGELCVCDLAWICERPENLVSHHLKILRGQGLAASRPEGKMVLYELTEAGRWLLETAAGAGALSR